MGDITEVQAQLPHYDLVLMVDVIEHIPKPHGERAIRHWIEQDVPILVSTPVTFFEQHLFQSRYEEHVSHWRASDFRRLGHTSVQYAGPSGLFLLTARPVPVRGFGNGWIQRLRRCARFMRNEVRW